MRPRESIVSQLLIAFSVFAVLLALAVTALYLAVGHQSRAARALARQSVHLQQTDDKLGEAFSRGQFAVLTYGDTGNRGYLDGLEPARKDYDYQLGILEHSISGPLRGLVTTQSTSGGEWWSLTPRILAAAPRSAQSRALANRSSELSRTFYTANTRLKRDLTSQAQRRTATGQRALITGLAWGGLALALALLLLLAVSLGMLRAFTWPLRDLTRTVRRLTAGDRSARAPVTGSAAVREVAHAVNSQADEADRLRAQEEANNRLRSEARAAGIRIREHLLEAEVIRQAQHELAGIGVADKVYLHLTRDGKLEPPVGTADGDWLLAGTFLDGVPEWGIEQQRELLKSQASLLVEEPPRPGGVGVPGPARRDLQRAGIASCLLTPFGVGTDLLGVIAALRMAPGRSWSRAETDVVESIAADLGRGLGHARTYEAENRLVEELQGLDRAKSDFFATVSHELRAPLTSIEGYLEILSDEDAGPLTGEQRRMLETVGRSAVRLRNLIEDVFMLAKLESGVFAASMQPVNLTEVAAGAVAAIGPSVAANGLTLTSALPDSALVVQGDAGQLDRVFSNLLSNAVKFTPEGGRVEVTGEAEKGWAVFRVTDTGIGIPEADRDKLFSRFFRASNATERAIPGTGLGLAIVSTVVAAHHGELDVQSQVGQGTTVTVRLPLLPPGHELPAPASSASRHARL